MVTKISGGEVISQGKRIKADVYFENGKITAVTDKALSFDEEIDATGKVVSAGLIDMHTHGAGGYDFLDNTTEAYIEIAKMHAKHGATVIVPTVTSSTKAGMADCVKTFEAVKKIKHDGAQMPGLHMEGPYFSMSQKGAQDARYIRPFDPDEYEDIVKTGCILRWTGAPELDGAEEFAEFLTKHGVSACIGHSDADCDTVRRVFPYGFKHVTHLYSCTSTVHRKNAYRYAGIVEAAYLIDDMTVEIIADGVHLPKDLLEFVYKFKGIEKTALITDSMRGAGMPDGESILGGKETGMKVIIEDGVAKLPDRSAFAGSVAMCDRLIRTMTKIAEIPLEDAIVMATKTPAKLLKLENKGDIIPGYDADIVIFDDDINIARTIIEGRTVYSI